MTHEAQKPRGTDEVRATVSARQSTKTEPKKTGKPQDNGNYLLIRSLVSFLFPFLLLLPTWITAYRGSQIHDSQETIGVMSYEQFSTMVSFFSATFLVLFIFSHRWVSAAILNMVNTRSEKREATQCYRDGDGQTDRLEALIILAVFIFVLWATGYSTHDATQLFSTTLGSAVTALITIQLLQKLVLSVIKQYFLHPQDANS